MDVARDPTDRKEPARFTGRTAWARNLETPLREFLRTETGSAAVLLGAAVAALVWVNVDASSYDSVWHTTFTLRLRDWALTQDLRGWVNQGLMTFFFFVVGLEARREFDMGELRERRRVALPVLAGLGVDRRDHDQRQDVVHDEDREHERAQAVRKPRADEREHAQGERGVGRHRRSPPMRRAAARVERDVDQDGHRH